MTVDCWLRDGETEEEWKQKMGITNLPPYKEFRSRQLRQIIATATKELKELEALSINPKGVRK